MKYFDYAATTPIAADVFKTYQDVGSHCFFNSGCNKQAKQAEMEARTEIMQALDLSQDEYQLVFTSGGTESNNLAIFGIGNKLAKPAHFITSCFEHASVNSCFQQLERQGHRVTYINTDQNGHILCDEVLANICDETVMVSIMAVNNELGTRQPLEPLFATIKQKYPHIITMTDFVQGLGKVEFDFTNVDMFTISSHKIYGPKAVGGLIKKLDIELEPLIYGGTNEFNMRAGLQSLPAQVAFAHAVTNIVANFKHHQQLINAARDNFLDLVGKSKVIKLNCQPEANVVSICIDSKLENTEILAKMEERGFYLSARSADSAGIKMYSRSLIAIGLSHEQIDHTMRVSFSHLTSLEDTQDLVSNLEQVASL